MSDISPINRTSAAGLDPASRSKKPDAQSTAPASRGNDSVQLSTVAQMLSKINQLPAIRQDLVDQVKNQIANGTYETQNKLNTAVQNVLKDLAGQYHN